MKLIIYIFAFCQFFVLVFSSTSLCQEIPSSNIKFILSEDFQNENVKVIDYSVRTTNNQYGYISTYIGFTTNKLLPSFVINLFDKENQILFQTDDYYRSNPKADFKNSAFVYHCYIPHMDSNFIKTIVIEKQ
jgi:hypothetical protein